MFQVLLFLLAGVSASSEPIKPLGVLDFRRARIQGLNPGEEFQIELTLKNQAEIVLRGRTTEESFDDSALLLNLTIKLSEGATLRIGGIVKTKALPIRDHVSIKLSYKDGRNFSVIIDDNTFYEGPGGFAVDTRYIGIHGDALVTKLDVEESNTIKIINNVATISLKEGDSLTLEFRKSPPYIRLALLDQYDNQNLYMFTGNPYIWINRNTGEGHVPKPSLSFSYKYNSAGVILVFKNTLQGLELYANGGFVTLWKHDESATNRAYDRLYIDPNHLGYLKSSSISRKK
ncbi:unnamed protein product [Bursaphelenchus xylophilus]|uniref:(pine wood nematode) hypothetical protein n=1 Tax=Bursaphelenchus xylophilus TaxID=6326 RepID=A0A1I7SGI1_BURXY|nr:unnamed protein product [Bursaphelenchus xylophilus]CAG9121731.1 unnamed protein product [Bursaphelenchus xylophilus]